MRRRPLCLLLAGLVLALVEPVPFSAAQAEPVAVQATRIPLYPGRPQDNLAGALLYRGGLQLSSGDSRFGELSDLAVSADGSSLLAISDAGRWLRARLAYDANGNLAGFSGADMAPLLDMDGQPLTGSNGDAEGLALERANDLDGPAIVSFERNVRVWRYDLSRGPEARPANVPIGDWVRPLANNAQLEAIVLWRPDTLIAFAEAKASPRDDILAAMEAYPGSGSPRTQMLSVAPRDPFSVTGAATAPGGGLFLVERRFSFAGGVGTQIRRIGADEIHAGARLQGEVLANLSFQDANIDNMEGIAVRPGPRGETFLYLVSDNNFSSLQRTLLLMFEVRN